jgi:hypothetical protein
MAAATLQDLAQRISQQEAELLKLRQAFETRQAHLTDLTRRKGELESKLQQIEAEIQGVGNGAKAAPKPVPVAAAPAKPATPKPATKSVSGLSLPQMLVKLIKQANRPLTIKELAEELVRHKFPSKTNNLSALIKSRVSELIKRGVLRRAGAQPGVVLDKAVETAKSPAGKGPATSPSVISTKVASPKQPAPAKAAATGEVPPLGTLLVQLLAKSPRPLKARELAAQALARGYKTTSQNFVKVIWVAVNKMDNLENVPGKGYRLKKGKTVGS